MKLGQTNALQRSWNVMGEGGSSAIRKGEGSGSGTWRWGGEKNDRGKRWKVEMEEIERERSTWFIKFNES